MVGWTREQEAAINARNSNLLVSAAAGSGKTAVLVERIIKIIISDKIDIDSLLIVTFTNAAAGEMRERISKALLLEQEKKDANEEHIRKQINILNKSYITTLHSFCIDIVKSNHHMLEIDPIFRIGDNTEINILKHESIEELFEKEYEIATDGFTGLVEMFGSPYDDFPLKEWLLKLYEFVQSQPDPNDWLKIKAEAVFTDLDKLQENPSLQVVLDQISWDIEMAKDLLIRALKICQKPYAPENYRVVIESDIVQVENLAQSLSKNIKSLAKELQELTFQKLPRASKDADDFLKEEIKGLREKAKKAIKDIQENVFFQDPQRVVENLNKMYPYIKYLCEMVMKFSEIYKVKKNDRGIVDFNDLEHFALQVLSDKEIAKQYQNKFKYIFIDEYQDSNIIQETIINQIKAETNLFFVGDVKQSIYRFRLADPSLFLDKYYKYCAEENTCNRRIDLTKNFRSRKEILSGINFLFTNLMSKDLGEIKYDTKAMLYSGLDYIPMENSSIEVNIVDKKVSDEIGFDEELEELEDIELEATIAAQKIKALLNTNIFDSRTQRYRVIEYRDIVILLRTTKNWAKIFLETFIKEQIPAYADTNNGYFEVIEISIFINLLKIVDNKRQDIPLLSVLRSPIGGFTTEELINIRLSSNTKSFYEATVNYCINGDDDSLKQKMIAFYNNLDNWFEKSRYQIIDEFIWQLMLDTNFYYYVGAMPGGKQRQANLRILVDRAAQFQRTSIKGLFNFIKFIEKLQTNNGDMGTAKTLGENDNVVRILSIHKSKGLEFPVVIVGGMGKGFNLKDTSDSILLHKDLGFGPKYVDPEVRVYSDTLARTAIRQRLKIESLSEEMRILYVALTRAKDKLILLGAVKDLSKQIVGWRNNNNKYSYVRAKTYFDWICPILMKHEQGEALRSLAGVIEEVNLLNDESQWSIQIINKADIKQQNCDKRLEQLEIEKRLRNFHREKGTINYQLIKERLNWQYPFISASKIPSKLSVTNLKQLSVSNLENFYSRTHLPTLVKAPKFMDRKRNLSSVEKGVATHFVMQHLDLNKVSSIAQIKAQIENLVEKELILEAEASQVIPEKIYSFFISNLGKRMLKASMVYRERPFNLVKKACDIVAGLNGDVEETLLIQGVIDCYFVEDEEYILIDYKTDFVPHAREIELINKYQGQIKLYREALEAISGKKVKESYLYSFHNDQEFKIN